MARIIECDRCEKRLRDENAIFCATFAPIPKNIDGASKTFELCESCFDEIRYRAQEKPPRSQP